jgi:predicted neuraminidase
MIRLLYITGIAFIIILLWQLLSQSAPGQFVLPENPANTNTRSVTSLQTVPLFSTNFASHESTPEVHSAAAIELADNDIMAFWYGGTREGHKDVNIYANRWSSKTKTWGNDQSILTREDTKENTLRYIRKLGNPVVTRGPDNAIWLFYVSVSVGGWAGSSINLTRSYDEGQSWSPSRRLITSPFLNLSTLIKGAPIHYTDGTLGLPVYHEFLGKFSELLRINTAGEVIDKKRLSWGKTSLQPIILVTSADSAVAMMRNHGNEPQRILTQSTSDAGQTWSPVAHSALPNPDAGIMGLRLINSSQLLLAFNNHEEEREDMSLAVSPDNGKSWQIIGAVEENRLAVPDKTKQFSYPWLLQTQNGTIHLLYTWHKSHIKHIAFDQGWLERQPTIRESDKQ